MTVEETFRFVDHIHSGEMSSIVMIALAISIGAVYYVMISR